MTLYRNLVCWLLSVANPFHALASLERNTFHSDKQGDGGHTMRSRDRLETKKAGRHSPFVAMAICRLGLVTPSHQKGD